MVGIVNSEETKGAKGRGSVAVPGLDPAVRHLAGYAGPARPLGGRIFQSAAHAASPATRRDAIRRYLRRAAGQDTL